MPPLTDTADTAVLHNFRCVLAELKQAETGAGRPVGSVRLVAVGKTHPASLMRPLLDAGHRLFGENRVQEAAAKWPALKTAWPDIQLHLIGPLQTNKVRDAVALFDVIETVDRPKLAAALAAELSRSARHLKCFIQVNVGLEPQKAGVSLAEADGFIDQCRERWGLPVEGLMCIPPVDDDPLAHFVRLADLARRHGLGALSMGMSADWPVAVRAGATHVRLGTAIFGRRPPLSPSDSRL
jgi:pyridoxal phosphate enzyme (YggS family)